ncbi:MAG: 2-iminobutanoate/2-iminopropanoate deaminase [Acidobacteriota bacterium]|jgi:2-iminobutanoate/2-iminopropanoate deaminase|nr:2-iminobutanoate/2-iminopropanoate deaminase [Acidobacteriota bacterium]
MREIISTDRAPAAIGPYSQAVKTNGLIFASGQIPLDPQTGQFVEGGVAEQTHQVMRNLEAVLNAAGANLQSVVKTTVFLADMDDFQAMNEVYGQYFSANYPARATVQAARLPRDARVEIDLIAVTTKE